MNRPGRRFVDRTSASTGIPLAVCGSRREPAAQIAKWPRVLEGGNYRFTGKVLSYTALSRPGQGRTMLQHFGLMRRRAVSGTLVVEEGTNGLLVYRPDVVDGVRTTLARVANELTRGARR